MILLWGAPGERPLARVAEELEQRDAAFRLVDQRDALATSAALAFDHRLRGEIAWTAGGERLPLDAVTAVYHRCQDTRRLPLVAAAGPDSPEWRHVAALEDVMLGWLEATSALVVNRPSDMGANSSKPYQLALIAEAGLRVPDTLVTTDPAAAEAFWARHGEVIYKSVSGVRSKVSRLRPVDRARLADVAFCPTQLQELVPGTDYRVHVVRDRVFATRVESDADDYRYTGDGPAPTLTACALDPELADRCVAMCARMRLHLAGVDLRRTPRGDWYCFEVNPSPAFSYYEDATGQPIAAAVAELLVTR